MGVYIPPNNNNGDQSGDQNGGNPRKPTPVELFLREKLNFGTNPSFGLHFWGPLVPPPDNRTALKALTAAQFFLGLGLISRSFALRSSRLLRNGRVPSWSLSFKKYTYGLVGLNLIFNSGLETTRLISPFDPWQQERQYYTDLALRNGQPVHWWFGPKNYVPMTIDAFVEEQFVTQAVHRLKSQNAQDLGQFSDTVQAAVVPPHPAAASRPILQISSISRLLDHEKFTQIYNNIRQENEAIANNLLTNQLKDESEINKGNRLDLMMEGKYQFVVDENYPKPPIVLGNRRLETDDDLDAVWDYYDPWAELQVETDISIRLIPPSRFGEEEDVDEVGEA
ncbi:mitochondrial inner membrane i-AAA protease complex subunit [Yamadazyma tenuis]|uniref:I-AAA protease complex subunit Mgr1 n=1 Tax=Candida tenuis (strain ATCC 10573 / BCRC 21748 / CBS 615 / JCM 9827 / NBRC 10315 / NRRL Y-1498 / VKM Y-70) TaxID=590646 RepID=G3BFN9_CANTC|nr:i-AAA protease complex subunit Mgr1 [Yamadazyma tenuis ATCC 10573]EGV60064.1 i-AAA protease complex subunit Mgr1 [Yamadazyma tenuis ATCC 10573]WEJ94704.1 mitochondrial inner membrane i-AAA protease complex subunit [Yamadazyma tenuis]